MNRTPWWLSFFIVIMLGASLFRAYLAFEPYFKALAQPLILQDAFGYLKSDSPFFRFEVFFEQFGLFIRLFGGIGMLLEKKWGYRIFIFTLLLELFAESFFYILGHMHLASIPSGMGTLQGVICSAIALIIFKRSSVEDCFKDDEEIS